MAEEASNLFDAVRKANRAAWEQASGRKPSDKSRAIPPPTGRESPLEGADALAMVAALSAKLSDLQARVDFIEDDFPEPEADLRNAEGKGDTEGDYAFKVSAVEKLDGSGNPYNPPKYNVRVLGGPAQVLGGVEKVFDDLIDEEATEGDYVYVQYNVWSNINVAICEWVPTIIIDTEPPFDEIGGPGVPKTLVFCIAKIGAEYINNVNQYRLGAIQAVAVLNASPEHDTYHTIEIP